MIITGGFDGQYLADMHFVNLIDPSIPVLDSSLQLDLLSIRKFEEESDIAFVFTSEKDTRDIIRAHSIFLSGIGGSEREVTTTRKNLMIEVPPNISKTDLELALDFLYSGRACEDAGKIVQTCSILKLCNQDYLREIEKLLVDSEGILKCSSSNIGSSQQDNLPNINDCQITSTSTVLDKNLVLPKMRWSPLRNPENATIECPEDTDFRTTTHKVSFTFETVRLSKGSQDVLLSTR
eukprot:TRINITY_DN3100_c0_g1_i1.p1 TRINITY_DN3100_c0_g1~~TRINITY_DN3100_c0_g1_i1.p1  ORF type:complete len:236 (+),score=14.40 TRINITY_DN3100_c0_g1_i1:207-914(+)